MLQFSIFIPLFGKVIDKMDIFRLQVKKSIPFISTIIDSFIDCFIHLYGDFSEVDLSGIADLTLVKGKEEWDKYDRVTFTLTRENVAAFKALLPRIGIHNRIIHIEIEQGGYQVFGAYDQFDKDCVWVTANVGEDFIKTLFDQKIIWKYERDETKHHPVKRVAF
jgi:hypothetical protein